MARGIENYPNTIPPDSDYPNGQIKDDDGSGNGTPVDREVYGDMHQFFAKILREVSISPSGIPDNEYSGIQYYEAFLKNIYSRSSFLIIEAMLGSYTTNDLIIFTGLKPAPVSTNCTWSDFTVYYNGDFYKAPAGSYTLSGGELSFTYIISNQNDFIITIGSDISSGIIAPVNSSTVKYFDFAFALGGQSSITPFTLLNGYNYSGVEPCFRKDGFGNVHFSGRVRSPGTVTSNNFANLPSGYRPVRSIQVVAFGLIGTNDVAIIDISTSGVCTIRKGTGSDIDGACNYSIDNISFSTVV